MRYLIVFALLLVVALTRENYTKKVDQDAIERAAHAQEIHQEKREAQESEEEKEKEEIEENTDFDPELDAIDDDLTHDEGIYDD